MQTFLMAMNYRGGRPDYSQDLDERTEDVSRLIEASGGRLVAFYRTQGRFDALAILEMPDAETIQAFNLANQDEHWTVETMRAFTIEEYPAIWDNARKLREKAGIA